MFYPKGVQKCFPTFPKSSQLLKLKVPYFVTVELPFFAHQKLWIKCLFMVTTMRPTDEK